MKQSMTIDQLFDRVQGAWDEARGERAMPARGDIDPIKLGPALRHVTVIDVVAGDPIDFRYRVLGEQVIQAYGSNITGQLHTDIADRSAPAWPFYEAYVNCVTTHRMQSFDIQYRNHNKVLSNAKGRVWPLSEDGRTVSGLLGACMFFVPQTISA